MHHATGSFTGLHNVSIFTQHWLPDIGTPRAVIVIAHGYAEHSGRYTHVADVLAAHGYAAYALDHRGHGKSEGLRAQVSDFDEYVADLHTYIGQIRAAQPDRPIVLYGHSMGSLVSLLYAERRQDDLAGLITSGTALKLGGVSEWAGALVNMLRFVRPGWRVIPALPAAGISHDSAVVERYVRDPLVYHGRFRFDTAAALVRASKRAEAVLPKLQIPYLALHGGDDPLTLPEGATIVREVSGAPDTTVKVYPGLLHEIHNEAERDQVFEDLINWLDQRFPAA